MKEIEFIPASDSTVNTADVRRWGRSQLSLTSETTLNATRLNLLNSLAEENFVPSETYHHAAWVLENEALGIQETEENNYYRNDRRAELAAEVSTFTTQFFEMTPALRQAHWQQLLASVTGYKALELWLQRLEPGLKKELPDVDSESETLQTILAHLRELFVLPPPQKAARRRQLIAESEFKEWSLRRAVERINANYYDWNLVPGYLEGLEGNLVSAEPVLPNYIVKAQKQQYHSSAVEIKEVSGSNPWPIIVAALIAISLVKFVGFVHNESENTPYMDSILEGRKILEQRERKAKADAQRNSGESPAQPPLNSHLDKNGDIIVQDKNGNHRITADDLQKAWKQLKAEAELRNATPTTNDKDRDSSDTQLPLTPGTNKP